MTASSPPHPIARQGSGATRLYRAALTALATLAVASLMAWAGASWQARDNHRRAQAAFDAVAQRVLFDLGKRMESYAYGVRGARAAVLSAEGDSVGREAFRRYAATREVDHEFPGARGFGVVWRVQPAAEADFVDQARRDGWPDFAVRQLAPHEGERYVIQYIEPVAHNRAAVGLDLASEPRRRDAALAAMRSGQPALTAPITLVQAAGQPIRAFLLLAPIYKPGAALDTAAQRTAAALGWAYAPLLIDEVLQTLGDGQDAGHYQLWLSDKGEGVSEPQPFHRPPELAGQAASAVAAAGAPAELLRRLELPVYDRTWVVELHATTAFEQSLALPPPSRMAWPAGLIGALGAALLAMFARLRLRAHQEHIEQARRAAIVEASDDAIIGASLDGVVTDWNGGAERLFGFKAHQVVGRRGADVFVPEDRLTESSHIVASLQQGLPVAPFDTVRRHQDGSLMDVSLTAAPIFSAAGVAVGIATTIRDVRAARAARQAQAALNANLEQQVAERTAGLDAALHDLRAIIDAMPSQIGYWDRDLRNRVANLAYQRWYGLAPEALNGRLLSELLGAEVFARRQDKLAAALAGQPQQFFDHDVPAPDGIGMRHVDINYLPDIVDGEVRGIYTLVHDITEGVEARHRLANAERNTEALLNTLHQHAIVSVADRRGRITEVNDAFCAISGYSRAELIGQDHRVVNSGRQTHDFWAGMWRTVGQGSAWRAAVCNRAKDGSLYWVDSIIAPMRDAQGRVEQYISIRFDITAARITEERLRASEAFLERAGQVAGVGGWALDLREQKLVWSAQTKRIHEVAPDFEPELDKAIEFYSPGSRPAIQAAVDECMRSGQGWDLELTVVTARGRTIWVRAVGAAELENGEVVRLVGAFQDISERKALDEALATKTAELARSNTDLGQFASVAAHDLQEPLRMVASYTELLAKRYQGQLDERADKYIHYAVDGAKRMQQLIEGLLTYSRVGAQGKPLVPVSADAVLARVLRVLHPALTAVGGTVEAMAMPMVMGDEVQLDQLFQNLLANAIKFRSGAPLQISVAVECEAEGDQWHFTVTDNGIGLNPEFAERVFQMFQRLHERGTYEGSGIGLSVVKRVVERHGGRVWLTSAPGVGTSVHFTLLSVRQTAPAQRHWNT